MLSPFILHLGFVQNWIAGKVCDSISEQTKSTVTLGEVKLSIFKGFVLKDLYISSPNNALDTMAFIGEASTSLSENILTLIRKRAHIQDVNLFNAQFQISTTTLDSISNLERFLNGMSGEQKSAGEGGQPISLDLKNLNLKNVSFDVRNSNDKSHTSIKLDEGHVGIKSIDSSNDSILIESLSLYRPVVGIYNENEEDNKNNNDSESDEIVQDEEPKETQGTLIKVGSIEIHEGAFTRYNKSRAKTTEGTLDVNNLNVIDVTVVAEDFVIDENSDIVASINDLSLKEQNGFEIEKLAIDSLRFNDKQLLLSGLDLNTQESRISDYIEFKYDEISDFGNFAKAIDIDADLGDTELTFKDLIYFFPELEQSPFFKLNRKRKFKLTGKLEGTVNDLYADNMLLSIDNLIELSGSLSTHNLTNSKSALINLYVDELNTSLINLKRIIPGFKPPSQFYRLDPISFTGDIEGFF